MKPRILILAAAAVLGARGQEADAVARIREAALTYGDRLQNFTCIQTTVRSTGPSANGKKWKRLDTHESEVAYVDRRESYKPLRVNGVAGEPAELERRMKAGYFRGSGQFGSALQKIFEPRAKAQFERDVEGGACVFRYRVAEADSAVDLSVNGETVRMGHHGTVWADCETGAVLRFFTETDPAAVRQFGRTIPVGYQLDVQYAPVKIGDKEFLLPQHAVQTALYYRSWTKTEMRWTEYRKYDASSTVTFEK